MLNLSEKRRLTKQTNKIIHVTGKLASIILLGFLLLTASVSAHPGKTDEYGGHYDNETGGYHYHHGYPAHEHINGVCPYDFDDQTNHQSEISSNSTITRKPEYHTETPDPLSPKINSTTIKDKSHLGGHQRLGILDYVGYVFGGGIALFYILCTIELIVKGIIGIIKWVRDYFM